MFLEIQLMFLTSSTYLQPHFGTITAYKFYSINFSLHKVRYFLKISMLPKNLHVFIGLHSFVCFNLKPVFWVEKKNL